MNELDMHTKIRMLDRILTSDDERIRDAFDELVVITTLVKASNFVGPLETLINETRQLRRELDDIRRSNEDRYAQEIYRRSGTWPDPMPQMPPVTMAEDDLRILDLFKDDTPTL